MAISGSISTKDTSVAVHTIPPEAKTEFKPLVDQIKDSITKSEKDLTAHRIIHVSGKISTAIFLALFIAACCVKFPASSLFMAFFFFALSGTVAYISDAKAKELKERLQTLAANQQRQASQLSSLVI